MNENQIIQRIMAERYRRSTVCPRYTPTRWWECDVFELTEAGFFREYEVKISKGDFAADRLKDRTVRPYESHMPNAARETKHSLLANGSTDGQVQFWYVTPAELVDVDEIPTWAGLIWVRQSQWGNLVEIPRRQAPRLHNQKAPSVVRNHLTGIFYYRFHDAFQAAFKPKTQ